jgi:hypothetical protein
MDLRFRVDHTMELYVQGDVVRYRFEGQAPSDDASELSQPLPSAEFARFEMEKESGRGDAIVVEPPSAGNGYTAKMRISDPRGGDDRYHLRLRWETAGAPAAPAPAGDTPPPPRQRESSILSRHIGAILNRNPGQGDAPLAEANPLPGVELTSNANDPSRYNSDGEGKLDLEARVDGSVILRVRGDRIFAENESGRPIAVERFVFSQPLPSGALSEIRLDKRGGRGDAELLEKPWEGNGYTAVVRVSDPRGGDDGYQLRLTWKR